MSKTWVKNASAHKEPAMSITIRLNGETRSFDQAMPIAKLLAKLKIAAGSVVVERNAEILHRDQFSVVRVEEGDQLEIIRFVGGG
jgi:thiamine biosynthesis protein ThiS